MQTVVMQTITRVARTYLGLNQTQFAKAVNLTQPDLSELEQKIEPFGAIAKYRRISDYLGIPVDTLLRNDFTAIPEAFFEKFPPRPYRAVPKGSCYDIGRDGEEWVLHREQERLAELYPALSKLVLPFYKMDTASPGFDILSFDALGVPYAIEVKTSRNSNGSFRMTCNEYAAANEYAKANERYILTYITNFGTDDQTVEEILFSELRQSYQVRPSSYSCLRLPEPAPITGLAYFRRLRKVQQLDLAAHLGMPASNLCLAESGVRALSAAKYLAAAKFLDTSVDALLETYTTLPELEAAYES